VREEGTGKPGKGCLPRGGRGVVSVVGNSSKLEFVKTCVGRPPTTFSTGEEKKSGKKSKTMTEKGLKIQRSEEGHVRDG